MWERGCGRIRDSPFKIQVYFDLFVKWKEGPRGVHLYGDFDFFWRRTSVPIWVIEYGCLSIPRALVLIWGGWSEEQKSEVNEDVFTKDFVIYGARVRLLQGPRNKVGHALEWETLSLFSCRASMALTYEAWRGGAFFSSSCTLQIGEHGNQGKNGMWECHSLRRCTQWGSACDHGESRCRFLTHAHETCPGYLRNTWLGWGEGSAGGENGWANLELLLLMYWFVSKGWWALGTFWVSLGPTLRILMYNLMRRHRPCTR